MLDFDASSTPARLTPHPACLLLLFFHTFANALEPRVPGAVQSRPPRLLGVLLEHLGPVPLKHDGDLWNALSQIKRGDILLVSNVFVGACLQQH